MGGNLGDHKFERDGVWELRVDYGPGYRVYYSIEDGEIILLLTGGNKKTQTADLDKAVSYLQDFKKRSKKMTTTKNVKSQISKNDYPAAVDHNAAMIEELRADPDYANAYLANALEEINEPGGLGGFLVALRQVIEARGGGPKPLKNLACPSEYLPRIIPEREPDHHNTGTTCSSSRVTVHSQQIQPLISPDSPPSRGNFPCQ